MDDFVTGSGDLGLVQVVVRLGHSPFVFACLYVACFVGFSVGGLLPFVQSICDVIVKDLRPAYNV